MKKPKGKRFLSLLNVYKRCPLGYTERVVYSYLAYQSKFGGSASVGWIEGFTKLSREAIPPALETLIGYSLVEEDGGQYAALVPTGESNGWFVSRKVSNSQKNAPWADHFAYCPIYIRSKSSPLTDRFNALYWLLRSLDEDDDGYVENLSEKGLATLLSISRTTVRSGLACLKENEIIRVAKGKTRFKVSLAALPEDWLCDTVKKLESTDDQEYVWENEIDAKKAVRRSPAINESGDITLAPTEESDTMTHVDDGETTLNTIEEFQKEGKDGQQNEFHDRSTARIVDRPERRPDHNLPGERSGDATGSGIPCSAEERKIAYDCLLGAGLAKTTCDLLVAKIGHPCVPGVSDYLRMVRQAKDVQEFKKMIENFVTEEKRKSENNPS